MPLGGVYYWVALSIMFVFLLFINFRYCSKSLIDFSLGRDVRVERDSAWVVYFGVFISSLLVSAVIVQEVEKQFPLVGVLYFFISGLVFVMVFSGLCIYVKRLRRQS
ncbi:hypothetical protein [Pseudomonas sp. RIT-PI-q]|uniref:hypothetical protein n=1 Tax=Pseudomonas sp. RIT-PI-q TaxID=1690247 RepID=UPI00128FAE2D|nr:hypothetical protein [Pseudomonas sp. RIT-PI-q]